jgi:type III secretion protein V
MEKLDETRPAEDYMLRHFQSLITKNLSLFSGHQEIHDRLEADWSESAQAIAADPDKITLLTRLVRALLDEQVPTRHFSVICDELEKTREVKLGLDDLLALVRMLPEIRATLPANDPQVRLLKLSDEIETAIKDSITKEGDEHVLELEPEITQEILTAVRNEAGNLEASLPIALIVGEGPVRRYTRKLMELEFPQLSVVSEEEFLEPWDERFVATAILK